MPEIQYSAMNSAVHIRGLAGEKKLGWDGASFRDALRRPELGELYKFKPVTAFEEKESMREDTNMDGSVHIRELAEKKKLSRDEVSWLRGVLGRLLTASSMGYPRVTREALKLGSLLEIMDVLGYEFEDKDAAGNAIADFRPLCKLRGDDYE